MGTKMSCAVFKTRSATCMKRIKTRYITAFTFSITFTPLRILMPLCLSKTSVRPVKIPIQYADHIPIVLKPNLSKHNITQTF